MSAKFLELNLSEFSSDQPDFLIILPAEEMAGPAQRNVCVCCLDNNGPFVKLGSCAHSGFVETICGAAEVQQDWDIQMMVVCRLCHSMLHKIHVFKKQVEESIQILRQQALNWTISQIQVNRLTNNLQHSNTTPIIIFNNIDVGIKIEPPDGETTELADYKEAVTEIMLPNKRLKKENCLEKAQTTIERVNTLESTIYLKDGPSIKIELDTEEQDSDFETNLTLSEVKKEIIARRCKNNLQLNEFAMKDPTVALSDQQMYLKSYRKSAHIEHKYEGKIREVILTLEEVKSERENALSRMKLPFKCLDCVTGFEFQSKLEEHTRKTHMSKAEIQCEICKGRYAKSDIRVHYIRHYIRYECSKCSLRYKDSNAAFSHYSRHDDVTAIVHSCKQCNMTFNSYRALRHHVSKHSGRVGCAQCDKNFASKAGLRAHILIHHNESPRTYRCEPCNKVYKEKQTWSRHVRSEHSDSPPPRCDTCHVVFKSAHSLWCHLNTSSKHVTEHDKKFVCDHCGMRYIKKSDLKEHVNWVHLKRTDHACHVCDKAFMNYRTLRRHVEFVHDKKPRPKNKMCDHCGRGFSSEGVLRCHMRTHTGERPLRCDVCDATFAQSAALYNHRKLKHKITPNKQPL